MILEYGVLMLSDLHETGNRFSLHYFNLENGQYLDDYERTLGTELPSLYYVEDSWDNYNQLKPVLDKRFAEWQQLSRKKPSGNSGDRDPGDDRIAILRG